VDAIGKSFLIEGDEDPRVRESGTEESSIAQRAVEKQAVAHVIRGFADLT